jgi:hypothetical protein
MKSLCLAAVLVIATVPGRAPRQNGPAREDLVASPAWLAAHLHDANLVVLQVGAMSNQEIFHSNFRNRRSDQ